MQLIKIVGICILIFTIARWVTLACQRRKRRLALHEELSRLLHFIKRNLECYLMPLGRIAENFESELLFECGFLEKLRGSDASSALRECGIYNELEPSAARLLEGFFGTFGRGYFDQERRVVDSVCAEFDALLSDLRMRTPQKTRLFGTIGAAASLALLILMM